MDFTPCVAPPHPVIPRHSFELRTISAQTEEAMFTLTRRSCFCVPYIRARGRREYFERTTSIRFSQISRILRNAAASPLAVVRAEEQLFSSRYEQLGGARSAAIDRVRGDGESQIGSTCSLKAPSKAHNFPFWWRPPPVE